MPLFSNFSLSLPIDTSESEEGVVGKHVIVNQILAANGRRLLFDKFIDEGFTGNPDHVESLDTTSQPGYWVLNTNAFVTNTSSTLEALVYNVHRDGRESLANRTTYRHREAVPTPGVTIWNPIYREN